MANLPPRKTPSSVRGKQNATPLQILLQMGFPRHRALKALAATGNRSVQLASDWLLTHVNDNYIDADEPREYILYASPTGPLLDQLLEFWDKSKTECGWNGAHNFPPHITLVSFFKAPDETSLQIAKAVRNVVETVGEPPKCPLKLEPYVSHNFMGLFVSEEHADYLKKIAVQYVKQVSSILGVMVDTYEHLDALGTCFPWCAMAQEKPSKSAINLEAHVKSLHITLAYHFDVNAYEGLKTLVEEMQPVEHSNWELRLYSRDPRFASHQVHKVTQNYSPHASDELELVIGDYIYVEDKELVNSVDGWVHGTSWLTGLNGYLPASFARRTAESDAWTLHRSVSLGNNNCADIKSESDSNNECEMSTSNPNEEASSFAREKSEESFRDWDKYWDAVRQGRVDSVVAITQGIPMNWETGSTQQNGDTAKNMADSSRRWLFAMRHGERVDLTFGPWIQHCFDEQGKYIRRDLNMPLKLGERVGGAASYSRDSPLTRVGSEQARLVGEALRLEGLRVPHVYASPALRSVQTAHAFLEGLEADPSVKIRVEPGLFEFKTWYIPKGLGPFMTPQELHNAGLNVDVNYKPYVELDLTTTETVEEFFERAKLAMHGAYNDTAAEGGNIMFVGHAATLDQMAAAMMRLRTDVVHKPYEIYKNLMRVPYCAVAAVRDKPWDIVNPPCPPSINSSSGRYDWTMLLDFKQQNSTL